MFEFPEPLFEAIFYSKKVCLVCGQTKASSVLRTTDRELIPLCKSCSSEWNFYGYYILKKIKPKTLILNLIKFKILHPFHDNVVSIYKSMKDIQEWAKKMKKFKLE
jgi:NAD-dependent SIR2 family protein deacetylase